MDIFSISGTPNPNSVKITTDKGPFLKSGLVAFNSPREADGHPLGEALFSIDGLQNLLVTPVFVTVTKAPDVAWEEIMPGVKKTLRRHLEELHD